MRKRKRKTWKYWMGICLALLTLSGAAVLIVKGINGDIPYLFSKDAEDGELVLQAAQQKADTENFHFQINTSPTFEDGKSRGALMITNPSDNEYNMQVTILLDDTEEEIYRTDILAPGERVGADCLSKELEKGTYTATAIFDIMDLDTNEKGGQISAEIRLIIQK